MREGTKAGVLSAYGLKKGQRGAASLPGPALDLTVFGLTVLLGGSYMASQLWPILAR